MPEITMDNVDRKLLGQLQAAFPLTQEPYAELGLSLGIGSNEVMHRISNLKAQGIVRQISPVLDARKLGYQSTLVALKVAGEHLKKAERCITEHPGVSHGYERNHDFNIWITLAMPEDADINTERKKLASCTEAKASFDLPAVKVFKLRTHFGADEDSQPEIDNGAETDVLSRRVALSSIDKLIINGLQEDLPLVPSPFNPLAERLGIGVSELIAQCKSILKRGIIRRFGASVNHYNTGYKANAMSCWVVPSNTDAVGKKLASLREVSHCYERKPNAHWRYNLYAMIHGHTRTDCEKIANKVSGETGLTDYVLLFSTREFKKTRIKYLV